MSKKTESIIRNFEHVGNSDMFKIFWDFWDFSIAFLGTLGTN